MVPTISYSDVVSGIKVAEEDSTPENPPLAWRPASTSPTKEKEPQPDTLSYFNFPSLDAAEKTGGVLLPQGLTTATARSWAEITSGITTAGAPKYSPEVSFKVSANEGESVVSGAVLAEQEEGPEDVQASSNTMIMSALLRPPSPAPSLTPSEEAEIAEKTALWGNQEGADLRIRCHTSNGIMVQWNVHSEILIDMSEGWMEKYMPPEAEDGSMVQWDLFSWDAGMLNAVLQYMYLESFPGGLYPADDIHNLDPLVDNVAHFIAGTGCLCRHMMDRAIDQIEMMVTKITKIQKLFPSYSDLSKFEESLRRALCIMYDEPDQWRIRSLRMVVGKLVNVCFPLLLKNARWDEYYKPRWTEYYQNGLRSPLQIRVVNDHKWLYESGFFPRNADIMSGFDHMEVTWVRYRHEGWKPEDDKIFPDLEDSQQPAPLPSHVSAPTTPAGGKKKSKAIPIINPSFMGFPVARLSWKLGSSSKEPGSTAKGKSDLTGMVEPGRPTADTPVKTEKTTRTAPSSAPDLTTSSTSDMSPALVQATPDFEDPFKASTTGHGLPAVPSSSVLQGNAAVFSYPPPPFVPASHRPLSKLATPIAQMSLPSSPARTQHVRKALAPGVKGQQLPLLPDGHFHFAENSLGFPDPKYAEFAARQPSIGGSTVAGSNAPSVAGMSSDSSSSTVTVKARTASAAESSVDPGDLGTLRLADLSIGGHDEADDRAADGNAIPGANPSAPSSAAHLKKQKNNKKKKPKK